MHAALKAGRAPDNKRFRHIAGTEMHAKVYLSDEGAVVCSANATQAALSAQNRIEDGIWVKAGGRNVQGDPEAVQRSFRRTTAVRVGQAALDAAPVYAGRPNLPDGPYPRRDPAP